MKYHSISIIFPVFNEEKNIESAVLNTDLVMSKLFSRYEIIAVNDGSTDRTADILNLIRTRNENIRVITHEKNRGYGAALKSGFINAKNELVFFSDSDNQFNINEIKKFIPYIEEYDVVAGYRQKRNDNFSRRIIAFFWKVTVKLLFSINYKDINCAFKLFTKNILEKIKPENLISEGATVNAEIFYKLNKVHAKIKELPVSHFPRKYGKPTGAKVSVMTKAFYDSIKLKIKLRG